MNSKGQSLVAFVLLIPIIFILITLVWEIGNISLLQSKYENEIKEVITYYLKHEEDENILEKTKELLDSNLEGEKEIEITENIIKVHVKKEYNAIYQAILKSKYSIDITYSGYKENDKIIINRK